MINMIGAKMFAELFPGMTRSFITKDQDNNYETIDRELTLEDYLSHIKGNVSIGVEPRNDSSQCKFGMLDFDGHKSNKKEEVRPFTKQQIKKIIDKINFFGFPLSVFKSNSGGLHAYMFFDSWIPARDVRHILKKFSYALGYERECKEVEIFPKSDVLEGAGKKVNLPYTGGNSRVLLNSEAMEQTFAEFLKIAPSRLVNQQYLEKFKLLDMGREQHRNERTFAAAVFLKHHYQDWEKRVHAYNELFNDPPLGKAPKDKPNRLEATILMSVRKKDYTSKENEKPPSKNPSAWREGTTAKEIYQTNYIIPPAVVEGLIYPGTTFISGKSKIGKSLLAEQLCDAVENGGEVFGCKCAKGKVLHYSLEDGKIKKQTRWKKMGINPTSTLYQFRDRKPKIPLLTMGLEEEIEDWIKNTPEAKMVIIDPYVKAKKTLGGHKLNAYENDNYNLQNIYTLATKYNIAIVFFHHTKKKSEADVFDEMTGSQGIQSNADSMIMISSNRKMGVNPILSCIPKDAEQKEFEVSLSPKLLWEYVGKPGQSNRTKLQKLILESIKSLESGDGVLAASIKSDVVAKDNSFTEAHVQTELGRLAEKGEVLKLKKGVYKLANY
jgi:hypothetical protein